MPYTPDKPPLPETPEQLAARIPGWGADKNPADRPSYPRERTDLETGAHWTEPEQQPELAPRERSIEHARLTPVFGTAQPLHGLSGAIRRHAYAAYSEGRAAHWLLLIAADRVDAVEQHLASFATPHPDNPVTETGVLAEGERRGLRSRAEGHRVDRGHQAMDPVLVAGPWVLAAAGVALMVHALRRRLR
ncbi:hypothetical protein CTKZ_12100 [Cellulomonas algicola]|uniref:Uncharacterized protein n=1 Tax=Cellulomonas algicola TaxID=2071633 RepID=A0A401UY95_9CELL|nr:hypothetical protein [Cellulomonas algicola]GCD19648.1 hypothetical protein CTKZ_12100 [Cellulomonas algicola]